jgi:hypothetical protein
MKKQLKTISNPDELNKNLSYSSPATWITLTIVIGVLVGFFVWTFIGKIQVKVFGKATVTSGNVALTIKANDVKSIKEGQTVYLSGNNQTAEGEITSVIDDKPVVSTVSLTDGEYDYYIIVSEMRPFDFWLKTN